MKKKFLIRVLWVISIVVAATVIIESCNKLNLTPLDKTTTSTFFTKKSDFDAGIFAAYSSMQDLWMVNSATAYGGKNGFGSFWAISMLASDDVAANSAEITPDAEIKDIDDLNL